MSNGYLNLSFVDHDAEVSTAKFRGPVVTDVNYAAVDAEMDALLSAVDDISLCSITKDQRVFEETKSDPTPPSDQNAQRERKWLVRYRDTVNYKLFTKEIPGADLSLLDSVRKGYMDIASGAGATFVSAFEAYQVSEYGNPVEVVEIAHVGRNL